MACSYYITARQQLKLAVGGGELDALREKVRAAFAASVDYVQVREKDLPTSRLLALVEALRDLPEKKSSRLLVNERLDIAACCGLEGVHLPSDSLPPARVRSWAGGTLLVGVSCHSRKDVEEAAEQGADYVLLGPVFETPSKPGVRPLGLPALEEIAHRVPVPVFALGGVTLDNAAQCARAGAAGIAAIRLFQEAENLPELCRYLRSL